MAVLDGLPSVDSQCVSDLGNDAFQAVNVVEHKMDRVAAGAQSQGTHQSVHSPGCSIPVGSETEVNPVSSQSAVHCGWRHEAGDPRLHGPLWLSAATPLQVSLGSSLTPPIWKGFCLFLFCVFTVI